MLVYPLLLLVIPIIHQLNHLHHGRFSKEAQATSVEKATASATRRANATRRARHAQSQCGAAEGRALAALAHGMDG